MLEFTFDDLMRIRSWHFMTRQHHELVPRSVAIVQVCFSKTDFSISLQLGPVTIKIILIVNFLKIND